MALNDLPRLVDNLPGFDGLVDTLNTRKPQAAALDGLAGPAKGFVLARLFDRLTRPLLVVTYAHEQAQKLWEDLVRFGVPSERVGLLPSTQSLFLEGDTTDFRVIGERVGALTLLAQNQPCIVIGTIEAVLQRTSPAHDLAPHVFALEAEQTIDLKGVITRLVHMGYEAANTVTRPGEFSRRGGIVDVFPSTADAPVRIELFGDDIESLRTFDVVSQRSIGRQTHVEFAPAREIRLSAAHTSPAIVRIQDTFLARRAELAGANNREAIERLTDRVERDIERLGQGAYFDGLEQYFAYLVRESVCALDYLGENGVVILDEPNQIKDHWERLSGDIASNRERRWERGESLDREQNHCPYDDGLAQMGRHPTLVLSLLGRAVEGFRFAQRVSVNSGPLDSYRGQAARVWPMRWERGWKTIAASCSCRISRGASARSPAKWNCRLSRKRRSRSRDTGCT